MKGTPLDATLLHHNWHQDRRSKNGGAAQEEHNPSMQSGALSD
jgi:hypothetical protein